MSEETAIIVTAPANGADRRYGADGWAITDGALFVTRDDQTVACHAAGLWTSFRTSDAVTDDGMAVAYIGALSALRRIRALAHGPCREWSDLQEMVGEAVYQLEDGEMPDYRALLGRAVRELADSGSPGQNALGAELARDGGIEP